MASIAEGKHSFEYCVSNANGMRSVDAANVTITADTPAGSLLEGSTAAGYTVATATGAITAILGHNLCFAEGAVQETAVTARDSEVNYDELSLNLLDVIAGDKAAVTADLDAVGIVVRNSVAHIA